MTIEADQGGAPPSQGQKPPDGQEAAETPAAESVAAQAEPVELAQAELSRLAEAARFATPERAAAILEALFFAAEKPLDLAALREITQFSDELIAGALAELEKRYAPGAGGVVLVDLGGRWQLRSEPQVGAYVRRMLQVKPMRLTRAAMETLAIVAYRQPVTRPEIEDLRGVDSGAVTRALLERKLIRILGKKDEPGRPLLYGTTKEFLGLFNLRDLTQLPTLREFQELSEESRKIVEEEAPAPAPKVAGISELTADPRLAERMGRAAAESDAALEQLESAMAEADEQTKTAASVLAPTPADANPNTNSTPTSTTTASPTSTTASNPTANELGEE